MSVVLLRKYQYIGQHPTKVSAVPYAPAVELEPGDELVSQIRLPSHLFKEIPLTVEDAVASIGSSQIEEPSQNSPWEKVTVPQLVELLKNKGVEIPKGTSKKADFIALAEANGIEVPNAE
jgi:hypothetical protein|nr:MAG TPA: Thymopoietin protein [Caudoviricetes sp.]